MSQQHRQHGFLNNQNIQNRGLRIDLNHEIAHEPSFPPGGNHFIVGGWFAAITPVQIFRCPRSPDEPVSIRVIIEIGEFLAENAIMLHTLDLPGTAERPFTPPTSERSDTFNEIAARLAEL